MFWVNGYSAAAFVPDVVNVDDVYLPYIWLLRDKMCIAIGNVAVKTAGSVETKTNLTD